MKMDDNYQACSECGEIRHILDLLEIEPNYFICENCLEDTYYSPEIISRLDSYVQSSFSPIYNDDHLFSDRKILIEEKKRNKDIVKGHCILGFDGISDKCIYIYETYTQTLFIKRDDYAVRHLACLGQYFFSKETRINKIIDSESQNLVKFACVMGK